jgi:hypothetical protein
MRWSCSLWAAILAVGCSSSSSAPSLPDIKARLKTLSREQFDAAATSDPTFLDLMHPAMLEKLGGRDKMIATVKEGAILHKMLYPRYDLALDEPDLASHDRRIFAFMAFNVTFYDGEPPRKDQGFYFWISEDKGANWLYVTETMFNDADVRKALPQLPKELKIPPYTFKDLKIPAIPPKKQTD